MRKRMIYLNAINSFIFLEFGCDHFLLKHGRFHENRTFYIENVPTLQAIIFKIDERGRNSANILKC